MAQSKAQKKLGGPRIDGDGPRQAKADAVAEVESKVGGSSAVLLSEYRGLTVSELAELRAGLRKAEAEYKVYKNTLARIAADRIGLTELKEHLEGPTAFTFALGDPAVAAKALTEFAKKVPALVLKAGILEGKVLSASQVNELGSLEPREVMLAKAAGMFITPIQQAANLLGAAFNQVGSLLVQLRDKLPGDAAPAEDAPGAEDAPAAQDASDAAPTAAAEEPTGADEPVPAEVETPQATTDEPSSGGEAAQQGSDEPTTQE